MITKSSYLDQYKAQVRQKYCERAQNSKMDPADSHVLLCTSIGALIPIVIWTCIMIADPPHSNSSTFIDVGGIDLLLVLLAIAILFVPAGAVGGLIGHVIGHATIPSGKSPITQAIPECKAEEEKYNRLVKTAYEKYIRKLANDPDPNINNCINNGLYPAIAGSRNLTGGKGRIEIIVTSNSSATISCISSDDHLIYRDSFNINADDIYAASGCARALAMMVQSVLEGRFKNGLCSHRQVTITAADDGFVTLEYT